MPFMVSTMLKWCFMSRLIAPCSPMSSSNSALSAHSFDPHHLAHYLLLHLGSDCPFHAATEPLRSELRAMMGSIVLQRGGLFVDRSSHFFDAGKAVCPNDPCAAGHTLSGLHRSVPRCVCRFQSSSARKGQSYPHSSPTVLWCEKAARYVQHLSRLEHNVDNGGLELLNFSTSLAFPRAYGSALGIAPGRVA